MLISLRWRYKIWYNMFGRYMCSEGGGAAQEPRFLQAPRIHPEFLSNVTTNAESLEKKGACSKGLDDSGDISDKQMMFIKEKQKYYQTFFKQQKQKLQQHYCQQNQQQNPQNQHQQPIKEQLLDPEVLYKGLKQLKEMHLTKLAQKNKVLSERNNHNNINSNKYANNTDVMFSNVEDNLKGLIIHDFNANQFNNIDTINNNLEFDPNYNNNNNRKIDDTFVEKEKLKGYNYVNEEDDDDEDDEYEEPLRCDAELVNEYVDEDENGEDDYDDDEALLMDGGYNVHDSDNDADDDEDDDDDDDDDEEEEEDDDGYDDDDIHTHQLSNQRHYPTQQFPFYPIPQQHQLQQRYIQQQNFKKMLFDTDHDEDLLQALNNKPRRHSDG